MNTTPCALLTLLFALALPAAAQSPLKCPDLKPKTRQLKTLRMQPQRLADAAKESLDALLAGFPL